MLDLVIRAGKVVDGTGRPPQTADVGVAGGRIVEVGRCSERAKDEIDADGLLVTPGFVDIHTHFDGQATWDPYLAPSAWHGVTTVAMGNCGVGFAPAWPDRHDWLISLMEGVEDIPGAALAEGLTWAWQTFPEYLDALDGLSRVLDVGAHVPHAALRAYVMGERGANPDETPTDAELQQMKEMLSEAVAAGAIGLGSSRTQNHRTSEGYPVGTLRAAKREMVALASALKGTDAVIQMISDAYQSTDPEFVAAELDLIAAMAATAQRPLSFSLLQPASAPDRWREIQKWAMTCQATGLEIKTQVAPRPIGILLGLEASVNPLPGARPTWRSAATTCRSGWRPWPIRSGGSGSSASTPRSWQGSKGKGAPSWPWPTSRLCSGSTTRSITTCGPRSPSPEWRHRVPHRRQWPTTCCSSGAGRSCSMFRWPTSWSRTCRR